MVLVTYVVIELLLRSPIGQAIAWCQKRAMLRRGDEESACPAPRHRLCTVGILTGVAGASMGYFGRITPTVLSVALLINVLAWMVMVA